METTGHSAVKGQDPIEIAPGIWWVGSPRRRRGLSCNPYLLIDGSGEAALFDPGSRLDFNAVARKIGSLLPLSAVKMISVSHQDPDLASSVPYFERAGFSGVVACHWRTAALIQYYGLGSELFLVERNGWKWRFASGREIKFLATPYLHAPGAIAAWDEASGTLFSGDLFGGFGSGANLYADSSYPRSMKTFHAHYMPSSAQLRAAMNLFSTLAPKVIAPQHGCVIADDCERAIEGLRHVRCGALADEAVSEARAPSGVEASLEKIKDTLAVDALTGLRNQRVFWSFAKELHHEGRLEGTAFLFLALDGLIELNARYGRQAGDQALSGLAYIASNRASREPGDATFKLNSPHVVYFCRDEARAADAAESLRNEIKSSDICVERLTASIGSVSGSEIGGGGQPYADVFRALERAGTLRCAKARARGGDNVCVSATEEDRVALFAKRVAIVDPDETHGRFLQARLAEAGYAVDDYRDGAEALEGIAARRPDIVVAETMVPRVDGFALRERMAAEARTAGVPFVFVSHRKDDEYLRRAASLRVLHYLRKPYQLNELLGLIGNLSRER
jgi:diguanylate cyclase (GGDEF)-like protein